LIFLLNLYQYRREFFSTTDGSSTFAFFDIFDVLTTNTLYANKLSGFFSIRADVTVRLQINANRFQQGRYILAWLPTGGAALPVGTGYVNRYFYDKTCITQTPHVEIDISTQTEVVFTIPYVAITTGYPINNTSSSFTGSVGFLQLYPYSPLASPSGSTTCGYEIFFSFHNVHLGAAAVPQMAGAFKVNKKKKTPSESEQASHKVGPLESFSNTVGSVAQTVGSVIPSLSWISEPVSWAADIASGVCSLFGWSNPIDLSNVTRAVQTWYPYAVNCDMTDSSMPLSLFGRNQIEIMPGLAGTDVDEASWDYIKTIPAYFTSFTLTTSDSAGANKLWQQCSPDVFYNTYTVGTSTQYSWTPITFFSNMFARYRGGLRFNFKIVKTEFHSGRIAVVYQPYYYNTTSSTSAATYANTAFAHREVIDIRETTEFSVEVPYTSVTPYLDMWTSGTVTNSAMGFLGVYVVNPITAPASVSSSITVLCEVCGAQDLEYAVPKAFQSTVVLPTFHQSNITFKGQKKEHKIISKKIGAADHHPDDLMSARACIGEKFTSVYQLLKSSHYIPYKSAIGSEQIILLDPYAVEVASSTASTYTDVATFTGDYYANITQCFLLSRGGIRVRTILDGAYPSQSTSPVRSYLLPNTNVTGAYSGPTFSLPGTTSNCLSMLQNLQFRGGAELTLPNYGVSFARINLINVYNGTLPVNMVYTDAGSPPYKVGFNFYGGAESNINFARQVSDDFQLGLFVCCPITVVE